MPYMHRCDVDLLLPIQVLLMCLTLIGLIGLGGRGFYGPLIFCVLIFQYSAFKNVGISISAVLTKG